MSTLCKLQNTLSTDVTFALYPKISESYNEHNIDEDDSLIDVSMRTDFATSDILGDLKRRINSVSTRTSTRSRNVLQEESMTDFVTRKISAIR